MTPAPQPAGRLRFDGFEIDLRSGELWKKGTRVRLQEQPFQVLRVLLERSGEIVTREELKQTLWPSDTFVDFDDGLNTAVKKIRDVLGDSSEKPRYIETVPRRGYCFVGPVEPQSASAPKEPVAVPVAQVVAKSAPADATGWKRTARRATSVAVGILALVVLLVATDWKGFRAILTGHTAAPRIESLAVLPLENLSSDPAQEYFVEGMTDELIIDLASIAGLRVISRTSTAHYKGTRKTLPEIAQELHVDAVVEGSVSRSANKVRVRAQLVRATPEEHLWAESYERDLADVLTLQRDVATAIAGRIKMRLTPDEQARFANTRAVNPAAYDAYLLGNFHSSKRSPDSLAKGIEYFQEAIRIDPTYAQAYAGLAKAYFALEIFGGSGVGTSSNQIRTNTLKALELDGNLAEGHALLGRIHFQLDWNWKNAETEFQRAIELNPNLEEAYVNYAYFLQAMGRHSEALASVHRAVELDPLSAPNICDEGRILYRTRQFENAVARYQRALELDPTYRPALGRIEDAYEQLGKYEEALAYVRKLQETMNDPSAGLPRLATIYARMGKRREAMEILKKVEQEAPNDNQSLAVIYAALGDRDHALAALDRGVQTRSVMPFVFVDPQLDPLRSDPRFAELVRKVGLPQ